MEDTPKNQTKFNALYWGQPVGRVGGMPFLWKVGEAGKVNSGFQHLELKSTQLLTEKEIVEIIPIVYDKEIYNIDEEQGKYAQYVRNGFKNNTIYVTPQLVDYLRLNGYAWEWMGISVEEQINRGWITLKLG